MDAVGRRSPSLTAFEISRLKQVSYKFRRIYKFCCSLSDEIFFFIGRNFKFWLYVNFYNTLSIPLLLRLGLHESCVLKECTAHCLSGQQSQGLNGTGSAAEKRKTLEDLFRPPIDVLHKGSFHSVNCW